VLTLAIDTTTAQGGVALVSEDGVTAERSAHVPGGHLEWLVPAIDAMLSAAGIAREAIEALAVSIGPGGFSGLRIGVATAAAWAHALDLPLVGVSTLEVIAAGIPGQGLMLAAMDARRGEMTAALFRRRGAALDRLTEDFLAAPDAVRAHLPQIDQPLLVAGDALRRDPGPLLAALSPHGVAAPQEVWWPRASVLGGLALERLMRGERDRPEGLVPRYARRPVACEFQGPPRGGTSSGTKKAHRRSRAAGPT
jgi:tRNA threonylcarbamoyladenosine biosynthesis protein TsaB